MHSPEQLNHLRHAAEYAWGDDTRHEGFVGHPEPSAGQCFVTAQWLAHKLGGHVGTKDGHYFYVTPDKEHIIDLTGDWFSHAPYDESVEGKPLDEHDEPWTMDPHLKRWRPGPVMYKRADHPLWKGFRIINDYPEHPRAQLFERRANAALKHHKTADLMGADAFPGETEQKKEDWEMQEPLIHDEPNDEPGQEPIRFNWVAANGQVQISPEHSHEELAGHAGFDLDSAGPFASGYVELEGRHAKWYATSNMSMRHLHAILSQYGDTMGWKYDGLFQGDKQIFGARRKMWYKQRKDGHTLLSEHPLPRGELIDIDGDIAYVKTASEGLTEWAEDVGLRLASYPGSDSAGNDQIKNREHLELYDLGDMKFQPERDNPDWQIENADMKCKQCGYEADSFDDLRTHHRYEHEPHEDEVGQNKFPWPHDTDDPLGFGTQPVPQTAWDGAEGGMVFGCVITPKLAARYPSFDHWRFGHSEDRFYGVYTRGQLVGYGVMDRESNVPIHVEALTPELEAPIRRLMYVHAKGQEPKDLIQGSIPFVYDAGHHKITIGYPGQDTHEVRGRFTPGGIVEGYYHPGGTVEFLTHTHVPMSTYSFAQLWYSMFPQMEITGVEHVDHEGEKQKVAGETHKRLLERASLLPEDQSEINHQWPDGWSMRRLRTYGDMYREGELMGNCFSPETCESPHPLWEDHPESVQDQGDVEQRHWMGGFIPPAMMFADLSIPVPQEGDGLFSLRDPDNIPHVSVDYTGTVDPESSELGRHNTNPKPHHMDRIADWYQHSFGEPFPDPWWRQGRVKISAADVGHYLKTFTASDEAAWNAYQALSNLGGKVYVVGGAVRDALQGRIPNDVDLMVGNLPPEEVAHALEKLPGRVDLTGKRFGVYRYNVNGHEAEIALPRTDKYDTARRGQGVIAVDHNLPVEQDLQRRDFTANSMAVDLNTGQLIDPYGGAKDLKNNVLRTTHADAFREDPTRLVRALAAHSRFGLHPDERTRHEMEQNAHLLRHESPDALNKVLDKLFVSQNPASAIRLAQQTGVLHHLFPEVSQAWDYNQNNPHHRYPLGDHLTHVLDNVSRLTTNPDVRMAALLHDIGKPVSEWRDQDGTSHYYENENNEGANHETVGAKMAEDRLRALNYPVARINKVRALVQHHMFAPFNAPKGARRFLNRVGEEHADDLLHLREADMMGKGQTPDELAARTPVDQMRSLVNDVRQNQEPTNLSMLAVNGYDIMNLGVQSGPFVGWVLNELSNAVLENPNLNNKEQLLELAQSYVNARPG